MRIALNLLYLLPGVVGGMEIYAESLIKLLSVIDSSNDYFVFLNKESANLSLPDQANFHYIRCKLKATSRPFRYFWEQFILPLQLYFYHIDLVHSLGYVGPLISPCPTVVTVPDLNFIALKDTMKGYKSFFLQYFSTRAAKRAYMVLTISNFSKEQISNCLNISPERITVTHLGAKTEDLDNSPVKWEALRGRYQLSQPYILAFGGGALHKNISRLIQAYSMLNEREKYTLVLVGKIPANVDMKQEVIDRGIKNHVIVTGYVPNEHVLPLLSHAELFVMPSLYEGFGLPILEAQQAGVTVVSSTAGSLPEVGGEGALYFDPLSVPEIVNTIHQCLNDATLQKRLITNGYKNLTRFSWERTAFETLKVYEKVYQISSISNGKNLIID